MASDEKKDDSLDVEACSWLIRVEDIARLPLGVRWKLVIPPGGSPEPTFRVLLESSPTPFPADHDEEKK